MKIKLIKIALILSVLLFGMQLPQVEATTYNGETTVNLNVRTMPSTKGTVVTTLPRGTKVTYVKYNRSWHKVYLNNRTYYASATYIRHISSSSSSLTTQSTGSTGVTTVNLNIRVSPQLNAKIVTTLNKGTEIKYANENSSWAKVYLNGKTYYAAKSYIKPMRTEGTIHNGIGYANREMKLFSVRNQGGTVRKVLPVNTAVVSKKYNSSWSIVYLGDKTYFTPTAWISAEKTADEPVTPPEPEVTKKQGYANRTVNLFGRTTQKSPVLHVLPKHTPVTYSPYNSSWSTVYIGSKTYFTATSWLTEGEAPKPEASPEGKVFTNTPGEVLNVRSSASLDSNILGRLDHGTEVEHYGIINGFYKFKYNGRDAYISSDFVTTKEQSPSSKTVIVIDAGHGGKDPGAVNGSLYEKTIALDVTKRVEAYLRSKYGYNVRLTRSTDVYLTLGQRVEAAKTLRGDLFVSVHANAATTPYAKGIETFYSSYSAHHARSRVLASNIQSNLSGKMPMMSNRGVKTANYYVIRNNTMPSALVELGFISSPSDVTYLRSDASRQRMAEGVAEGIAQYVRTYY